MSVIDTRGKKRFDSFRIITGIKLSQFTTEALKAKLKIHAQGFDDEHVLVCVDSVLGLPASVGVSHFRLLQSTNRFEHMGLAYGAQAAFHFFNQFINPRQVPQREVEVLVKANSVFKLTPYQKNIGCGSYRILKELSMSSKEYSVWPFEPLQKQFTIAEGYPSHFWRHELGLPSRRLDAIKNLFPKLCFSTVDAADSFVLAYGAYRNRTQLAQRVTAKMKTEGWILGVPYG